MTTNRTMFAAALAAITLTFSGASHAEEEPAKADIEQSVVANSKAPIPVYLPWGGAGYTNVRNLNQLQVLSSLMNAGNDAAKAKMPQDPADPGKKASAKAKKAYETGKAQAEVRRDEMQTLADGFIAGRDYALDQAKACKDIAAQQLILANRAFALRGCKWDNAPTDQAAKKADLEAEFAKAEAEAKKADETLQAKAGDLAAAKGQKPKDKDKIKQLEKERDDLQAAFDATNAIFTAKKAELEELSKALEEAGKKIALICPKGEDRSDLATLAKFVKGREVDKDAYVLIAPLLTEAETTDRSEVRFYLIWYAISLLTPGNIAYLTAPGDMGIAGLQETAPDSIPSGKPFIALGPEGARVDTEIAEGERAFVFDTGVLGSLGLSENDMIGGRLGFGPLPLRLMLSTTFATGSSTDSRHARNYDVTALGYGFGGSVGVEGVLKRWETTVALFYGIDIGLGYLKFNFRDETVADSVSHTRYFFNTDLRVGANFSGWVSAYAIAGLHLPLGGIAGGGIELTRLGPTRFAFEGLYGLDRTRANTGVAGSRPVDFAGACLRVKVVLVF